MKNETQTIPSQKEVDAVHSAAIYAAIDMEANFKLYSYRIVDRDVFIARQLDICRNLLAINKKLEANG